MWHPAFLKLYLYGFGTSAFEISEMEKYVSQGENPFGEEMEKGDRSGLAALAAREAVRDSCVF